MAITLDGTNGINSSGVIVAPDGSAAAPSITNDGDTNTGIFFPAADNIGFATGGTIRGRWTTDGLCFGSDTAAANALDDYEEGTWTPTLTSFGGTGLAAAGYYTKIGRIVNWTVDITGTNVTSTSNTSNFTMPFTAPSLALMGTCVAANSSTVSYGVGVAGSVTTMQTPTWSAAARIIVTGIMTT
jgi:hypothetical protein